MDEAQFIKEYMSLTGCTEAQARSAYMYAGAQELRPPVPPAQNPTNPPQADSTPAGETKD